MTSVFSSLRVGRRQSASARVRPPSRGVEVVAVVVLLAAAVTVAVTGLPSIAAEPTSTDGTAVVFGVHVIGSIGTVIVLTVLTVLVILVGAVTFLALSMLLSRHLPRQSPRARAAFPIDDAPVSAPGITSPPSVPQPD
jgi:hypothetical protein